MRRPARTVGALVALALVIRVVAVAVTHDYTPRYDAADYSRHAVSIAAGHGFPDSVLAANGGPSAFRPPLYPYLLGGVYAVSGNSITAARLVGAVLGAAAVLLIFLVGQAGWGRRVGLVAAALAAVFPPLVFVTLSLGTEALFLPLELLALWAVLVFRRSPSWGWAALAGAACGLAVLTRSNGLLLALPLLAGLWWPARHLGWRSLAAPALLLACLAVVVAPWTIRNATTFHQLVPVTDQSGYAIAGEYNPQAHHFPGYPGTWLVPTGTTLADSIPGRARMDEVELGRALQSRALDYLADHPGYAAEATALNTLRAFELAPAAPVSANADRDQRGLGHAAAQVARFSFYAACLLGIVGAAYLVRRRWGPLFPWFVPPLMLAAVVPFLGSPRYRSPVDPFVVLLAAVGLIAIVKMEWPKGRDARLSSSRSAEKTR